MTTTTVESAEDTGISMVCALNNATMTPRRPSRRRALDTSRREVYYYGYRWYSPNPGRWISPDLIGEEGGVNLYVFAANAPISTYDALGLSPQQQPASSEKKAGCLCCCVENLWFDNVSKWDNFATETRVDAWKYGHSFDFVSRCTYKPSPDYADCKMRWEERPSRSYPINLASGDRVMVQPGVWNDLTAKAKDHSFFKKWETRPKPVGKTVNFTMTDRPYGIAMWARRVLEFRITVTSAPNCDCAVKEITIYATQTLETSPSLKPTTWHFGEGVVHP
ncbi:MAG: RHS repeat-associated core domain-containing protein [Kiritimatiellae bacterium]|nr:RHS repeat-associated core domain-containing protein [Kiritimatiellia bacterium]